MQLRRPPGAGGARPLQQYSITTITTQVKALQKLLVKDPSRVHHLAPLSCFNRHFCKPVWTVWLHTPQQPVTSPRLVTAPPCRTPSPRLDGGFVISPPAVFDNTLFKNSIWASPQKNSITHLRPTGWLGFFLQTWNRKKKNATVSCIIHEPHQVEPSHLQPQPPSRSLLCQINLEMVQTAQNV